MVFPMQYQGQPHVLTIARDITEKKRAEQELDASANRCTSGKNSLLWARFWQEYHTS